MAHVDPTWHNKGSLLALGWRPPGGTRTRGVLTLQHEAQQPSQNGADAPHCTAGRGGRHRRQRRPALTGCMLPTPEELRQQHMQQHMHIKHILTGVPALGMEAAHAAADSSERKASGECQPGDAQLPSWLAPVANPPAAPARRT